VSSQVTIATDVISSFDSATLLSDRSTFFVGWAFDKSEPGKPLSWLVLQDKTVLMTGQTTMGRTDVLNVFGHPAAMSNISVRCPELFRGDVNLPLSLIVVARDGSIAPGGYVHLKPEKKA
jgi:hypothetical protein